MSFGDATVDLNLDSRNAEKDLRAFLNRAAKASTTVPVEADARSIPATVEKAVKSAQTTAVVEADTKGVTSSVESAVEAADTTAVVNADAGNIVGVVENAVKSADTTVDIKVPTGGFDAVNAELDHLEEKSQTTANSVFEAFRPTPGKIAALLGSLVIASGVQYNALVQRTTAAFETLLGSAEAASAKVQEIIDFARTSPFPRQVFLQATQTLISFGLEAERVVEVLGAVQDAVAATGGGAEDIQEITSILAEIVSTGKLGADALNQLGIRGIDAAKLIGEQMGKTATQIRSDMEDSALDSNAAFDALVKGLQENFGGAAANVKDTWVGAVDRVKAAVRDMASAIVEPFISTKGGGAAVEFANLLADALRRLQTGIVPVAQSMSQSLVPILEALGQELLPAVIDAFIAFAPVLGTTTSLLTALAPLISLVADVLNLIPDPLLAAAGAFLLFSKAAGAAGGLMDVVIAKFSEVAFAAAANVGSLGAVRGGLATLGDAFRSMAGSISPAQIGIGALAVGFAVWSQQQAQAKQNSADLEAQMTELGKAMVETEDSAKAFADQIIAAAEAGEDLQAEFTGMGAAGVDVQKVLRETGLTARQLAEMFAKGGDATNAWLTRQVEAGRISGGLVIEISALERAFEESAQQQVEAGITAEDWTKKEVKAAEQMHKNRLGGIDYGAVLDDLTEKHHEAEVAAEQQAEALAEEEEAYRALLDVMPRVAVELEGVKGGGDLATTSMMLLADSLNQAGASSEAIAHIADQLGVPAEKLEAFVATFGQHLEDLRADILEGLPSLEDVFAENAREEDESSKHWVDRITDSLAEATEIINNFQPNLEALNPWPSLKEFAARQGPEYTQALVDVLKDGNTKMLDEQEAALVNHNLSLLGFTGNVNAWAPTFASSIQSAAFLGAESFTSNFRLDTQPAIDATSGQMRLLQEDMRTAGGKAGEEGTGGFLETFKPSAIQAMNELPTQMEASGVAAAAQAAGTLAGGQFTSAFDPNVSEAMLNLHNQLSGWGVIFNNTMTLMGQGAAASFVAGFAQPDVSPAMLALTGALSGWTATLNGILGLMGAGAADAFVAGFSPVGELAVSAFETSFTPDADAGMDAVVADINTATLQLITMMALLGTNTTNVFFNTFKPDAQPALNDVLHQAQGIVSPLAQAGSAAGRFYVAALTNELQSGATQISAIVGGYANRLAGGLNPILNAIGKPSIAFADGGIEFFAAGGIEDHVAQIARSRRGTVRVWAEPETEGEAYIPLARSKRTRSRAIAQETVHRLGGDVSWYARGGVTGDTQGLHPIFLARLFAWANSLGQTYHVDSGFRSIAEQAKLYARWIRGVPGQAKAAPPGSSMHNYGLASDGSRWRAYGPGLFGLRYPMSFEPWHVEPVEARRWAGRGTSGEGWFFNPLPKPPELTVSGALAQVASAVMQHVYDAAIAWSTTAFGDVAAPQAPVTVQAKSFDNGGVLAPGWNMVANRTGRDEEVVPAGSSIVVAEGAVQVTITTPVTAQQARVIGRQVGRGFEDALAGRKVRTEVRLAGG